MSAPVRTQRRGWAECLGCGHLGGFAAMLDLGDGGTLCDECGPLGVTAREARDLGLTAAQRDALGAVRTHGRWSIYSNRRGTARRLVDLSLAAEAWWWEYDETHDTMVIVGALVAVGAALPPGAARRPGVLYMADRAAS